MKELLTQVEGFFRKKASKYHIQMAFLFGSRACGTPRKNSDIDIGLIFDEDVQSEHKKLDIISEISIDLETILGKEVNVVYIQLDIWRPMFYYNIIVLGMPVFFKDARRYAMLRWQAISQMEDFKLFGTAWQLRAARKNLEGL